MYSQLESLGALRPGRKQGLCELAAAAPQWQQRISLSLPDDYAADLTLRFTIAAILSADLTAQEKVLLIVLEAKITKPPQIQRTIAVALHLSFGRIKKMLAKLRARKIIITTKHGRENFYYVNGGHV